ncbi:MAG: glycosyltransferase family 4 protein [Lentisphaerae bacterium]|nr:glycosyltransferase family 4 protein [Lentisphaerota bacterium]
MKKEIALLCPGLDNTRGGYETHIRLLFENLTRDSSSKYKFTLFKGTGVKKDNEIVLKTFSRSSVLILFFCRIIRNFMFAYYFEAFFFSMKFILYVIFLNKKYHKIAVIDPFAAKFLMKFKILLLGKPTIIFTHSITMSPDKYEKLGDIFHQVNIENYNNQQKYFKKKQISKKVYLIPHFVNDIDQSKFSKYKLREKYGVKTEKILLSVGHIDADVKNMDYVIREAAKLPCDWTLFLVGVVYDKRLIDLGIRLLGNRFIHQSVPLEIMPEIYALPDLFVLASFNEGFGIVIIEAMRAGLPVILHNREIFRWILKDDTTCIDMSKPGNLANFIMNNLENNRNFLKRKSQQNLSIFKEKYSWESNKYRYTKLYE